MADTRPLALVTGASSGIGAAYSRLLARQGYNLILVARRLDRLEALAAELGAQGARVDVVAADLATDAGLKLAEDRIVAAPELEFLVNNAGFGTRGRFFEIDLAGQDRMHRLHVLATMRLTRAALAGMLARRHGAIVNVASVAGFWQTPGNISYCATKAWINSFTEGLWLELKTTGSPVRLQALCPGFTYSEFHDVMGVDRGLIPRGWWMSAEDVVAESYQAVARGTLFVVPGRRYKVFVFFTGLAPRRLRQALALKFARKSRRLASDGVH